MIVPWFIHIWELIKGGFEYASEVGMSEHDFLTIEWPYGGLNEDFQYHDYKE